MTIRTLNLLVEILTSYNFKAITIEELVGIEESTLTTALLRVERRGGKIDYLLDFLSFTKKTLAEFHHINPIVVCPLRLVALGAAKTVVKVESVNVECYTLCHITDICIIKKPSSDGHVHSRKNGGALIICCKDKYYFQTFQVFLKLFFRK